MIYKISLDVDATLAYPKFVEIFSERAGEDIRIEDITYYDFLLDLAKKKGIDFYSCVVDAWKRWKEIEPLEENVGELVRELGKYGKVDIVTRNRRDVVKNIEKWLKAQGIEYENLVGVGGDRSKGELDYDIYIDDNPHLLDEIEESKFLLIYDQPWNRELDEREIKNLKRIYSLRDAVDFLESLKGN